MNDKLPRKHRGWRSRLLLPIMVFILICAVVLTFPLRHRFASNPKVIVERFIHSYNSNDTKAFFILQENPICSLTTSKATQQMAMKFTKEQIGTSLIRLTPIEEIENVDYLKGNKDFRIFSFKCQRGAGRQHELWRLTVALRKGYLGWKIVCWDVETEED